MPGLASIAAAGLEIKSLGEVMAGDPQTLRKLYEVENEVAPDVPWYDDPIRRPFEEWVKSYEDNSVANLC